jgi:hypothetical protein
LISRNEEWLTKREMWSLGEKKGLQKDKVEKMEICLLDLRVKDFLYAFKF